MNCKTGRNHVLLANSGELSAGQASALERHLDRCENCSGYARQVQQMLSDMTRLNPAAEPADAVLANIRRAAAKEDNNERIRFFTPVRQFVAYAAALILLLTGIHALRPSAGNGHAEQLRIAQIGNLVEILSDEEPAEFTEGSGPEAVGLDTLAERLLRFQGLDVDEKAYEDLMFAEDTHSRDLQSRSMPASPPVARV